MDKKKLALTAFLASLVSKVSAQGIEDDQIGYGDLFSGASGIGEVLAGSMVAFMRTILGMNTAEELDLVIFTSIFFTFWLLLHMILAGVINKKGGILKSLKPKGKWEKAPFITPLLILSFLGSILTFRSLANAGLILLIFQTGTAVIVLALLILFILVSWALLNSSAGAGAGILSSAKKFRADMQDKLGEANQDLIEADNLWGNLTQFSRGDEEKVEVALEDVREAEHDVDEVLKADERNLEQALEDAKQALEKEEEEEQVLNNLKVGVDKLNGTSGNQGILGALEEAFTQAANGNYPDGSGGVKKPEFTLDQLKGANFATPKNKPVNHTQGYGYDFKENQGLKSANHLIDLMHQDAERLTRLENDEERALRDELQRLIEEINNLITAMGLYNKIKDEIENANDAEEYIEKYARKADDENLFSAAQAEEHEIKQLESNLQKLHSDTQQVKQTLVEVQDFLNNEVDLDKKLIQEFKQEIEKSSNIPGQIDDIGNIVMDNPDIIKGNTGDPNSDVTQTIEILSEMKDKAADTINKLERTLQRKEDEEELAERLGKKIRDDLMTRF